MGREKPAEYFQSFQGAHKALIYEHIPWGVVLEESVTLETLKQFPIVLLPNAAILAEREVTLLRQYVSEGGNLIVTGQSGQLDRWGKPLADSVLSELTGARVKARLESLRVHLLGYNSPPQTTPSKDRPFVLPQPIEGLPIFQATLQLPSPPKRAQAGSKSTVLKRRGGRTEVTVSDVHEIVVLRY